MASAEPPEGFVALENCGSALDNGAIATTDVCAGSDSTSSRREESTLPSASSHSTHTRFTSDQLSAARQEAIFDYDTRVYPFEDLMRRLCNLGVDDVELGVLHALAQSMPEKAPLSMAMMHGFKVAGYKLPKAWNKALRYKRDRLKRFLDSRAYQEFQETYHKFINEVVVPLIGDPAGIVYQDPPTFRVQVPSSRAIGVPHKDADYDGHVDEEINIWIPLTTVWGENTLHVESSPGKGDFHPLQLRYGQFVRFWGHQCHHYTVPNTTDATRVSFDFRLIPRSLYTNPFKNHIGDYPCSPSCDMAGLAVGPLTKEAGKLSLAVDGSKSTHAPEPEDATDGSQQCSEQASKEA